MKSNVALADLGQASHRCSLALKALRSYDLDVTCLRLIANDDNVIRPVNFIGGQKFVLWASPYRWEITTAIIPRPKLTGWLPGARHRCECAASTARQAWQTGG